MHKVNLYIISLWILFLLIAVKEFVFISWRFDFSPHAIWNFISVNYIFLFSLFMLALGALFYHRFTFILKGSTKLPKTIKKIEDQNYEHLTFLTTYIIPFLRIKLEGRDLVVTILLILIIGAIFIKTNLFYKNPTLALLGYRLYKVDTEENTALIFIAKEELKVGDRVHHLHLKDNVYYVKNDTERV